MHWSDRAADLEDTSPVTELGVLVITEVRRAVHTRDLSKSSRVWTCVPCLEWQVTEA